MPTPSKEPDQGPNAQGESPPHDDDYKDVFEHPYSPRICFGPAAGLPDRSVHSIMSPGPHKSRVPSSILSQG